MKNVLRALAITMVCLAFTACEQISSERTVEKPAPGHIQPHTVDTDTMNFSSHR